MSDVKLGELEFTAEDFTSVVKPLNESESALADTCNEILRACASGFVQHCNRILAEKLAKVTGDLAFTAEDFKVLAETKYGEVTTIESAVKRANARLAEKLAKAPVVYLNRRTMVKMHAKYWTEYQNDLTLDGPETHTARLVCIEKVKK